MKIGIVVGTRPEIIKMSPVIRACLSDKGCKPIIIHTGQHYSFKMDTIFFEELEIPKPEYNVNVGSGTHAKQTAKMMVGLEKVVDNVKPDVVLVQGDTNTVLGASLICAKSHVPLGHVEAGLRSFDKRMPEEINRMVASVCSDIHFAPTETAAMNLFHSGVPREKIYIVGNTVVDACMQNIKIAEKYANNFKSSRKKPYALLTLHRPENVDVKSRFKNIIDAVSSLDIDIIYPIHPRSRKMMKKFRIKMSGIGICDPMGYLEFLYTLSRARYVLTDSGGVIEEAVSLSVPSLCLRDDTDRPEAVESGGSILVGADKALIKKYGNLLGNDSEVFKKMRATKNPYGNGKAGKTIVRILKKLDESKKLGIQYIDMKNLGYPKMKVSEAKRNHLIFESIEGGSIKFTGRKHKILGPVDRKLKRTDKE